MLVTTRGFSRGSIICQNDMASSTTKGTRPGQPSEEGVIEFMKQGRHEKKLENRQHLAVGMTWLTEEPALVVSTINHCFYVLPPASRKEAD
jgi:hypothetical protein